MTFIVKVSDPTCPDTGKVMESAKAFAAAEGNPLPALLMLHDNPTERTYDLDDPADREAFEEAFGEDMALRIIHLEEGETFAVTCTKRVDEWADGPEEDEEEPMPVLAEEPRRCGCGGRPRILHEYGKGYAVQCEECWTSKGTWDLQLSKAIARWNGKEVDQ